MSFGLGTLISQADWLRTLAGAVGISVTVTLAGYYPGGSVDKEIAAIEAFHGEMRIKGDCASACTMWSTYDRVCTYKEARFGVHYAEGKLGNIRYPSLGGTQKLRERLTPTLQEALDRLWARRWETDGNPLIIIQGSELIKSGEVKECE